MHPRSPSLGVLLSSPICLCLLLLLHLPVTNSAEAVQVAQQTTNQTDQKATMNTSSENTNNSNNHFTVEPLAGSPVSDLGEGPHWDEARQELLYIDAFVGDVHRWEATTGQHHRVNLGDLVTIVIPVAGKRDQYLVSLRNKVVHLTWNLTDGTHSHKVLAEVAPERRGKERFNDGKVDALGRLWIGTLLNADDGSVVPGAGSLYKLDTVNGSFTKMSSAFTLSNGMAWNANNTLMYFNDSEDRKTYVFDFDLPNGTISNKRILVDYAKERSTYGAGEYPDGMAMDAQGKLWIALYGGGRVLRMEPSSGRLLASVPVPAPQTTSLAFGGGGGSLFDRIYVTTASSDVKGKPELEAKYPQAGRIFTITGKVTGGVTLQGVKAFNFKAKATEQ